MAATAESKELCFVIGPIGPDDSPARIHADWLLEGIIEPVMAEFPQFRVKRADQDARPGLIDVQMIDDLLNADLVIADLSLLNPNAFYEIGIRHMAQRPIIHMQLAGEEIPFDVSLYRAIRFSRTRYSELEKARADLKRAVEAVLAEDYRVDNPVVNARGRIKLEEHATSEQQVLIDQMQAMQDRMERLEASANVANEMAMRALGSPAFTSPEVEGIVRALRGTAGTLSGSTSIISGPTGPAHRGILGDAFDELAAKEAKQRSGNKLQKKRE
jgi:hypothetical protein